MIFFWGETAVGSCWEPLARDHVLLLGAHQPSADKMVRWTRPSLWTLGHSATSWGVGNPRNRARLAALFSGRRYMAATLAGLEKKCAMWM